jgi:hypothetical protein
MLLVVALAIMAQVPFSLGAIPLSNKTEYAFNLSSADSSTGNPKLRYNNCGSGFCDTSFSSCCWNSNPKVVSAPKCYDGCFKCTPGTCSDSFYQCVWIESCPAQMYMTAPEDRSLTSQPGLARRLSRHSRTVRPLAPAAGHWNPTRSSSCS